MPEMNPDLHEEIRKAVAELEHHAPGGDRTITAHGLAREVIKRAMTDLLWLLPLGRDRSLARTHLEEALMRANRAIALAGGPAEHVTDDQLKDRYDELVYADGIIDGE